MEPDEMRRYVRFLLGQLEEKQEQMNRVLDDLSELKAALKEQGKLLDRMAGLTDELAELRKVNGELSRSNKKLEERLGVVNNDHYNTSKSRKGIDKDKPVKGKNDDRSDFDGTAPSSPTDTASLDSSSPVYPGPSRKGTTYKKDIVGEPIEPKCDRSKLPVGTVILKVMKPKVVRTVVNLIEEHHFEVLKVKYPDGSIKHNELLEVEHLCCLARARNKFKDAYNQGYEKTRFFLEQIGKLYKREDDYRRDNLTATQTQEKRNDAYTNSIVTALQSELYDLLALSEDGMSDLMRTALNYLHKFWNQLFAYRKDGEYMIDNLAVERAIRPLTVQRKNSLFFCSTKGALRSAVYNTFIETCKQAGVSFRSFFCKYMTEIRKGRTDYENLLPMTITLTN